jgi:hypothetical protein
MSSNISAPLALTNPEWDREQCRQYMLARLNSEFYSTPRFYEALEFNIC